MCTGAILLYNIPRVVIGENVNFQGGDDYLRSRGVEVIVLDDPDCKEIMSKFIKEHPAVRLMRFIHPSSSRSSILSRQEWNEDIGEP